MAATALKSGRRGRAIVLAAALLVCACSKSSEEGAPPRVHDQPNVAPQASLIAVPVEARLSDLKAELEREVPGVLWQIDQPGQTCVASKKVKILIVKVKTPSIKCRIVGQVTRGPLTLSGTGRDIVVTMPIRATVAARDVAGVLKGETATGAARVRAIVRLQLGNDWQPDARMRIAYDWTREPGIDFLGQRITFTSRADTKLKAVLHKLERGLPRHLAKLRVRDKINTVWNKGFTSFELNKAHPVVWMRVTPRDLRFGGYEISGNRIRLSLGMSALTETFVGDRPPDPEHVALPRLRKLDRTPGDILFIIPVIAAYDQLEPVLLKALVKRSARPFALPSVGDVTARFDQVTVYGTDGGRIAVGIRFVARDVADRIGPSSGTVWLTARPSTQVDSRRVRFDDLHVSGATDREGTNLVMSLANSPNVSETIADALTQNFQKDFAKLLTKVDRAIAERREGELTIRAQIKNVKTGTLQAAGRGVYLPVWGTGTASIALTPN